MVNGASSIFCGVMARAVQTDRIEAVCTHWCRHCDVCVFFVDAVPSERSPPCAEDGVQYTILDVIASSQTHSAQSEKQLLAKKQRLIWRWIAQSAYSSFAWFLAADTDTFVDVGRLGSWLHGRRPDELHWLGRRFHLPGQQGLVYTSGGAGTVLSAGVMRRLAATLQQTSRAPATVRSACWREDGPSDVWLGACLRSLGITPNDTRDASGAERFHPFTPEQMRTYRRNATRFAWYDLYALDPKDGAAGVSTDSISFHYVRPVS